MIVATGRYSGYGSFGTASQYQQGVDCPPNEADWDQWCNCMFALNDPYNSQCKRKFNLFSCPGCAAAPWTVVGASSRGLPHPDSFLSAIVSSVGTAAQIATGQGGGGGGGGGSGAGGNTYNIPDPTSTLIDAAGNVISGNARNAAASQMTAAQVASAADAERKKTVRTLMIIGGAVVGTAILGTTIIGLTRKRK